MSYPLTMEWYDLMWVAAFFLAFVGLYWTWRTMNLYEVGTVGNTWFHQLLKNFSDFLTLGDQVVVGRSYLARLEKSDDRKNDGLMNLPQNVEMIMRAVTEITGKVESVDQRVSAVEESVVNQGDNQKVIMEGMIQNNDMVEGLNNMIGGGRRK